MDHPRPMPDVHTPDVATFGAGLVSSTHPPPHTDTTAATLVEMLSRIDALDVIPRLQVATASNNPGLQLQVTMATTPQGPGETVQNNVEITTTPLPQVVPTCSANLMPVTMVTGSPSDLPQSLMVQLSPQTIMDAKRPRVGRPRTKPPKEHKEWHYHLGGMRHCRVPLTPELKEVLEVAYVSRIMSKNFRKEGQPEKERIARITGMDLDKVQEWFKNRRKKDKLGQERLLGRCLPKGRGARRSTDEGQGVSGMDQSGSLVQQAAMVAERGVTLDTGGGVAVGQQIELQHQPPHVLTIGHHPSLQTLSIPTEVFPTNKTLQ